MRFRALVTLFAYVCLATLLGCLPTYVGDPEKSSMDAKYVGVWHLAADQHDQLWFVHKLDVKTYLVQAYNFKRADDNSVRIDEPALTMRAWLTQINGATFVSMESYKPQQLVSPKSSDNVDRYIVAKVELKNEQLTVYSISPDFMKAKNIATPHQFEQVIKDNWDDKAMYLSPQTFGHIDPKQTAPIQDLLDLIK